MPFTPKFVDLVRNVATAQGSGPVTLGSAVPGFTSLTEATAVAEQFYYCLQNIDKPAEREIGRGTMQANGTIARQAVSGPLTSFSGGAKTISLVVASDWFSKIGGWINGSQESLAALATQDKTSLVAAVNEVAASATGSAGGTSFLFVDGNGAAISASAAAVTSDGYASAGSGNARYIYDAAVNAASVAANPRTQFVAAGGRGFRLDPAQRLTVEMFGGRADYVNSGAVGTDNYAALMAATQFKPDATRNFSPTIHLGVGSYYIAQTLEPQVVFHLRGENKGQLGGGVAGYNATRLIAPTNTTVIRVKGSNTIGLGYGIGPGAADGSVIEGLAICHVSQGNDLTKHGIHARTQVFVRDCTFMDIAGHCIMIGATAGSGGATEGNANDWRVENIFCHSSGGDGLYVWGADANGGTSIGVVTHQGVGGCGIRDQSYFTNTHIGPQLTGYGNSGVHYGGRQYQLLGSPAQSSATTPGSDDTIWYDLRAGVANAVYPEWSAANTYYNVLPFLLGGGKSMVGPYVENGGMRSHSDGLVLGGNGGCTKYTRLISVNTICGGMGCQDGAGAYYSTGGEATDPTVTDNGLSSYTMLGTTDVYGTANSRRNIMEHRVEQDGENSMYWRWSAKDQYLNYYNAKPYWSMSGPGTARTYGRSTAQPYYFTLHDFALEDPGGAATRRIYGLRDAAPTTGNHARGEFFFNVDPSAAGTLGWSCTTTGTPGTWTAVPVAGFTGLYTGEARFVGNVEVEGATQVGAQGGYIMRQGMAGDSAYLDHQKPFTGFGYDINYRTGRSHIFQASLTAGLSATIEEVATINTAGLNLTAGRFYKIAGTQVVGARGAAVADATDAASAITQLNALLARCRAHGLIA